MKRMNKSNVNDVSVINFNGKMNKAGQQMTLGTIIAIVLGVAVLVFLIFGFSTGWNNLWDRVTAFGGGTANVDTINQACALACSTQSSSAYCNQVRTVKFATAIGVDENCDSATPTRDSCSSTCKKLSDNQAVNVGGIDVAPCPAISAC